MCPTELVHVVHQLGLALGNRSATDAAPDRDAHTGRLALERAEHQGLALQQVKPTQLMSASS